MDKNISVGGTCFNTADSMSRHRSRSSARWAHQIEPTVGSSLWWTCRRLSRHLGSQDDGARFSSELLRTLELTALITLDTEQKRRQAPNKNSRPISRASSMHSPWRVTARRGKTASHNRSHLVEMLPSAGRRDRGGMSSGTCRRSPHDVSRGASGRAGCTVAVLPSESIHLSREIS
jgi:hypothetical protein